jgi:hypothetical protein
MRWMYLKKSTKLIKLTKVLLTILIVSIGCIFATSCNYNDERVIDWRNDLEYLEKELPKNHINLYFKLSEKEFENQIKNLKRNVPKLNDDQIMVELMKIVSSIGDEHTSIGYFTNDIFPVKFYWFEDGIYVIDTIAEYSEIKQCKLSKINGIDIKEILKAANNLIPHSNEQWIKHIIPSIIMNPNVLRGMAIIDSNDIVTYTLINNLGSEFNIDIKSIKLDSLHWLDTFNEEARLYRKNSDKYYWYEYLSKENTIYYKHNVCRDQESNPFMDFSIDLFETIKTKKPQKLIIDLRNNSGGDSRYVDNIITKINLTAPELNERGKLYIIIGRQTFSSAVLNCIYAKKNSEAIFVGEATGGKIDGYGEIQLMELPNSKIKVSYLIKKFDDFGKEMDTFEPDINVKMNSTDYFKNRDPFLETILKAKN